MPLRHDARSQTTTTTTTAINPQQRQPTCEAVYLIPTRLATVLLALVQGGIIDCYLVHYNTRYWYAWIAGDVAVLLMFVVAFVISYRQMRLAFRSVFGSCGGAGGVGGRGGGGSCCVGGLAVTAGMESLDKDEDVGLVASPGSMPLAYFAWLVYSAVLAIRVLLVYKNFAHELTEDTFLGPNMLQVTVASAAIVFLLLLLAHHDAAPDSRRRHRIDLLTYTVLFDIVDAVDLLSVFFHHEAREWQDWITWCVLGVACLNLVLPTLPLMALSRTHFGARRLPEQLQTLHRLLVLLVINLPLLAVRLLLWHHKQRPVSTFFVKNLVVSFLVLYSFYDRDHHKRLLARRTEGQEMAS
nr:hypothetical protein BaRGS_006073 [Batillaria attramentaria]